MKKNKIWTRVLALCLAAACLIGAVGAAELLYDRNGDDKTDVWDLQMLVNSNASDTEKAAALKEAMGGKADELHPNAEGVYEIYSALGLYNMAEHASEGATFELMADIDLKGIDWAPVANFKGNFNGNGHTISNVLITQTVGENVGFFGTVDHNGTDTEGNKLQSTVKDLNLADVDIVIPEDSEVRYVGLLSGSNRGIITNCTTTGSVTDPRTKLAEKGYVGTIVGRNNDSNPNGKITGSNSLDALEYYDYEPITDGKTTSISYTGPQKVNSQMAMFFAELDEGSEARQIGIAGYSASGGVPTSLVWQDTTNSSKYDDPELLARRTAAAATMYEMSTVEWIPSQTMRYIRRTAESPSTYASPTTLYETNVVRRGLPYNHGSAGIDRFLAYMDEGTNRYTTKLTLPTEAFYFTSAELRDAANAAYEQYQTADEATKAEILSNYPEVQYMTGKLSGTSQTGFNMYIGADCSSQATWAWRTVSASTGTGAAKPTSTSDMYISQEWIDGTGIQPVNGFILELPTTDLDGDRTINDTGDKSMQVKAYTRANKDFYMETLACVTKGDLLMDYTNDGGHTLMAMSDAVVIRNYAGVMDLDKSYIVTAEQGGSGATRSGTTADGKTWKSSCCVDKVNTFNALFDVTDTGDYPSIFFPITCAALQEVDTPAATVYCNLTGGKVTSNFHIVSTTVNGETVYTHIKQSGHRSACTSLTLTSAHSDIATGDTVEVLLSNGQTYTFTY